MSTSFKKQALDEDWLKQQQEMKLIKEFKRDIKICEAVICAILILIFVITFSLMQNIIFLFL